MATANEEGCIYYRNELKITEVNALPYETQEDLALDLDEIIDQPFYPSDATLLALVSILYQKKIIIVGNISDLLEELDLCDWTLLSYADDDGYFGATFYNHERKQLVISHCNNNNLRKAAFAEILGLFRNQFAGQIHSACTYCAHVLQLVNDNGIHVSFTGHSFGAWLAQITTFTSTYLHLNEENEFVRKSRNPNHQVHTVAFDSPGCYEMLSLISTFYYPRCGGAIDILISSLDITVYFIFPNLINCLNSHSHVSRLLQIFEIKPGGLIERVLASYYFSITTLKTHRTRNFVEMMKSKDTKILTVSNWPRVKFSEGHDKNPHLGSYSISKLFNKSFSVYIDFLKFCVFDSSDELQIFFKEFRKGMKNGVIMNKIPNIYDTTDYDGRIRSETTFIEKELNFLKMWKKVQTGNLTSQRLNEVLNENFLPNFEIIKENGKKMITCHSAQNMNKLINRVKNILCIKPEVYEILKEVSGEKPHFHEAYYRLISNNHPENIPNIVFKDTIGMKDFLDSPNKIFCLITQNDTAKEILRIQNLLQNFNIEKNKLCFLNLVKLNQLEEVTHVERNFKNPFCTSDEYLIIDCKIEENFNDMTIVRNLIEIAKNHDIRKKLILVANEKLPSCQVYRLIEHGFLFGDFEDDTQKKFLERTLFTFKNQEFNLLKFFGEERFHPNESESELEIMKFLSKPDVINSLMNGQSNITELCSENIVNFEHVKIRILKINKSIEEDKLKEFYEQTNPSRKHISFVISGEKNSDLKNYLQQEMDLDNILLTKGNPREFYEHCQKNWEHKIYWLHARLYLIEVREVFDSNFYIERHFNRQFIIKDQLIEQEMKNVEAPCEFKLIPINQNEIEAYQNKANVHLINNVWAADLNKESMFKDKPHHTIQVTSKNKLIWKSSTGSIEEVRKMTLIDNSEISELKLLENDERAVIIADEPGMGKSFTLSNRATQTVNAWVLWVNLNSLRKKEMIEPFDSKISTLIKFLQKTNKNLSDPLLASMLEYSFFNKTSKPLMLFFDGFDEIDSHTRNEIIQILKYIKRETNAKILITTRVWAKNDLENALLTLAIKMKDISEEKELELIKNIWQSRLMCSNEFHKAAKELLDQIEKILIFDHMISIPLQKSLKKKLDYFLKNREILNELLEKVDRPKLYCDIPEELKKNYNELYFKFNNFFGHSNELLACDNILSDFLSWAWVLNKTQNLFVQRCLKLKKEEINDSLMEEVLTISYNQHDNSAINHFMGVPLQLRMIAEIAQPDFDSDQILQQDILKDIYSIYKESISKKIKIYFTEKLGKQDNQINEKALFKKHETLGFQSLFSKEATQFLDNDEIFNIAEEEARIEVNKLNQIGFIQIFDTGEFHFVHQSFAEYFAAHEILRLLERTKKTWSNETLASFIENDILLKEDYVMIRRFLNDYLEKDPEIFGLLKKDSQFPEGPTPIHIAINERNEKLAGILLDVYRTNHSLVDVIDNFGQTIFYLAVFNTFPKLITKIRELEPKNCIWKIKDDKDNTFILTYSYTDMRMIQLKDENVTIIEDTKEMKKILKTGKFETSPDSNLSGLLFCAAIINNWDFFEKLMNHFSTQFPNVVNDKQANTGKTMLHFVAQRNQIRIAKELLELGADVNTVDRNGNTPDREAQNYRNLEMERIIRDRRNRNNIISSTDTNAPELYLPEAFNRPAITSTNES